MVKIRIDKKITSIPDRYRTKNKTEREKIGLISPSILFQSVLYRYQRNYISRKNVLINEIIIIPNWYLIKSKREREKTVKKFLHILFQNVLGRYQRKISENHTY